MIDALGKLIRCAGAAVMPFYRQGVAIEHKADQSPLTAADLAAHNVIKSGLTGLTPEIPVISEEDGDDQSRAGPLPTRFWLVDPLDGTKEFIKGTGEFTINIALIQDNYPVLGLVYSPALDLLYGAEIKRTAWKQQGNQARRRIEVGIVDLDRPVFVASNDHAGPAVAQLIARYPAAKTRSMGSSLKFCLVAEGSADVYLRDLPTMEWDTAAAQCIVETAGGRVQTLTGERLRYGKPTLKNPGFAALSAGAHELIAELDLVDRQADRPKSKV